MSNSILSLMFPLSGEKCKFSRKILNQKLLETIPIQTRKLFSNSKQTKFGLLVTSDDAASCHQRRLLFQASITAASTTAASTTAASTTAAQTEKKVLLILPQPWNELPFQIGDESGVHKMPKMSHEKARNLTFIYPKNFEELFQFVSALGGSKEKPDLILIENVDGFISSNGTEDSSLSVNLSRLFAALDNLSTVIGAQKPFDILVTSSTKDVFNFSDNYFIWVDEIWETSCDDENLSMTFVDEKSPFVYRLEFSHSSLTNRYFFESISKESERDSSSPILK